MSVVAIESTQIQSNSDVRLDEVRPDSVQADDIVVFPPGNLYSDEPPLESALHLQQLILLLKCIDWLWKDRRDDYFAAGNLTVYYSPKQIKSHTFADPISLLYWEQRSKSGGVGRSGKRMVSIPISSLNCYRIRQRRPIGDLRRHSTRMCSVPRIISGLTPIA